MFSFLISLQVDPTGKILWLSRGLLVCLSACLFLSLLQCFAFKPVSALVVVMLCNDYLQMNLHLPFSWSEVVGLDVLKCISVSKVFFAAVPELAA